jgi:hypothetical protein
MTAGRVRVLPGAVSLPNELWHVSMTRRSQLALILSAVTLICVAVSHLTVHCLKISVRHGGYRQYGVKGPAGSIILHGSSLAYDGLDWETIARGQGGGIETWPIPGSSPAEWEVRDLMSPHSKTIVVVSAYDLNEYWLCDFRADVVPLTRSAKDLWQSRADWAFWKRILSQYPMGWVRKLFPTVGRSDGVMTGIRDKVRRLVLNPSGGGGTEGTKFGATAGSELEEKVSDWSAARIQRRLVVLRTRCQGRHTFNGPKYLALERLLQGAEKRGEVSLVVMPVSPFYKNEFLSPNVMRDFEKALCGIGQHCGQTRLVRLDLLPDLETNDLFYDFVHLNLHGRRSATAAFLEQSNKLAKQP